MMMPVVSYRMRRGSSRPKLAIYGAAACGGCEMTLLSLDNILFYLNDLFDLVFCPSFVDAKKADLEAMPDGDIAVTLFNGGIRMDDDIAMAHLLRRKSRTMVAFGSCAHEGCVPALADLWPGRKRTVAGYSEIANDRNSRPVLPMQWISVKEGALHLPLWNNRLTTLGQNVSVEYIIPGCPPEPRCVDELFRMLSGAKELPPFGSVIGAGTSAVCSECSRTRGVKHVSRFYRVHEISTDPDLCLIEQGIVCMGIATRNGCGCRCPRVNMPCSGCYGPPEGVADQGAAMISALASLIDIGHVEVLEPDVVSDRIDAVINTLPDYVGTFWRYGIATSLLGGLVGRDR